MPTNGMTINGLNPLSALTADDKIPVWDTGASGEPTKEITAQNMANSVKSLAGLPNTTEMNTAIAQSTAVETISQSDYITLADDIQIERWDGVKKSGKIIQASFAVSKSDGTTFGEYKVIGTINNPYCPLVRFVEPVSIAISSSAAVKANGNMAVTLGGAIAIYATGSNSNVVYVSMTYMIN